MENVVKKDRVMRMLLAVLVGLVIVFAGALIFAGRNASNVTQEFVAQQESKLKKAIVNVGGTHLVASVADTDVSRKLGLSNVKSIDANEGKMFVFDKEGYWEIWAKDMKFNFDIIWINDAGIVVDIIENVSPDTYPNSFKPKYPASKVLETNAGWVKTHNIKIGDPMLATEIKGQ